MQNPFESGHIKNYILLYVSVVVIMILFFIASTLFYDVSKVEKKVFSIEQNNTAKIEKREQVIQKDDNLSNKLKLLDKAY
ncbi:hypothetical protein [Sulfurimonas sp.]|uniref:hypothetical protein n=1 Tax=Sulfurimonas sp. TaxID=2022749 RepID=UPI0025D36B27|nr:hypothetical protein [Sulfurimonas sp.]MDD5158354.1 hypothetical protein [Sulfurimonas sp.]